MLTKIHGIVLSVVRHNDRHNIVTLFTSERGRMAFLSPAGGGRSGAMRNARLSPLAIIEADINLKNNRDLQSLGKFTLISSWHNLYFDPVKAPIVIFLSEFLSKILRTAEADASTWNFLVNALTRLDNINSGIANFHIAFLLRFMRVAGIDPDLSDYSGFGYFNMRTAEINGTIPSHRDYLSLDDTKTLPNLMRINFRNLRCFRLSGDQRSHIISGILRYYSLHLPISTEFKSLEILSEVFRS